MRVVVIGFGKMGMLHAGIVHALRDHAVCAISEENDFVAKSLAVLTPHIKVYADYKEMLDTEKPDAAFITTPVYLHVEMAIECIKRGIPFFAEKPLALSASDAKRLVDALEVRPTINMVGYMMRYIGTFRKAREIIASGALGEIISFNVAMYVSQLFKKGKGWRYDPKKSGGGLMMGPTSHVVDLAAWYFGPTHGINARMNCHYSETTEDFMHAIFTMKSGATGWLDSSWSVRGHRLVESRIEAHAANGKLVVTDDNLKIFLEEPAGGHAAGWTGFPKPELFSHCEIDIGGPQYTLEIEDFLRCVAEKRPVECDVQSSYEVHKVITAMYESANDHGNFKVVNP